MYKVLMQYYSCMYLSCFFVFDLHIYTSLWYVHRYLCHWKLGCDMEGWRSCSSSSPMSPNSLQVAPLLPTICSFCLRFCSIKCNGTSLGPARVLGSIHEPRLVFLILMEGINHICIICVSSWSTCSCGQNCAHNSPRQAPTRPRQSGRQRLPWRLSSSSLMRWRQQLR